MSNHVISIEAKEDFLERLSSASSINALAELVWNGLDAGSDRIDVRLVTNKMTGLEEIRVQDYGAGIPHDEVQLLFGNLGASWKKDTGRKYGRALHGKDGQGRFKAFALGNSVTWTTVYSADNGLRAYQIKGESTSLDALTYTDPMPATGKQLGTQVVVTGIDKSHGALLSDDVLHEFAKLFAAYLSKYPKVSITLNGNQVDPGEFQSFTSEIPLQPVRLSSGQSAEVSVSIVEWSIPTKRTIHLCDRNGVSLHELEGRFRAPGFDFTAYIKSDHFRELDNSNFLILDDLHPDVAALVSSGKEAIRAHFRRRLAAQHSQIVEKWKQEDIYPYEDKADLTAVEEAERQVFDILGVNLEAHLPRFDEADHNSRRFTFLLLSQALKHNPKSVRRIITEVLNLKQDEQEDLAALLDETSLSDIISSAKIVANRLDFLVGLENLLFDKDTKAQLLERDQLHKILETEAWLFDEDFALSGSEQRLEDVLQKHVGMLGQREDGETDVEVGDGKTGRIDLQLSRSISPRNGERDYLVVELKRPSKKIDADVITQVKQYAMAVANDERFHGVPAKWEFVAVSNEMNAYARGDANQPDRPAGQVWVSPDRRISVWVREWAEVINTARARLAFVNESLSYEATRESAKEYLLKTHDKFIPSSYAEDSDDAEPEPEDNASQNEAELATVEEAK